MWVYIRVYTYLNANKEGNNYLLNAIPLRIHYRLTTLTMHVTFKSILYVSTTRRSIQKSLISDQFETNRHSEHSRHSTSCKCRIQAATKKKALNQKSERYQRK
eukprot:1107285_1